MPVDCQPRSTTIRSMRFWFAESATADADVVVVGMPLDRTSSFIPGTRFAPDAARIGAENIESYSPYQRRDTSDVRVADAGNLLLQFGKPDSPLDLIAETTRANHSAGMRQIAVGGEHTITAAIIAELRPVVAGLCVVQFDAHADLRDEYLGERWCHATAMRRVLDYIPRERLFQLGIRSFSRTEETSVAQLHAFDVLEPIDAICQEIGERPVYVTLDVDVLDPGVLPDVQTPQPGGCSYRDLARALAGLARLNVVGADLVEYCPRTGQPPLGASTVAELVRELVLLLSRPEGGSRPSV